MTGLANRRVGIIGTGATAVQCIPHLSRSSGELFVFQRTPSSIDVRANRVLDYDELTPKMARVGSGAGSRTSPSSRPAVSPRRTW